jgi:hypothetical protein
VSTDTGLRERDRLTLEMIAEQRVVVTPHIQALLGVSVRVARERLRVLGEAGYIARARIFDRHPVACRITAKGLAAISSTLPPARIDVASYQHDVGVSWLWLAGRAGAFGRLSGMTSERELRSHDARSGRDGRALGVGIGLLGPGGREQLHYPDLMLRTADGKHVAIELELTAKGRARLGRIMSGYATDGRVDAVLYLVRSPALARRIEAEARRAGIGDFVHVQPLAGPPHGAPDHGRTLGARRPPMQAGR